MAVVDWLMCSGCAVVAIAAWAGIAVVATPAFAGAGWGVSSLIL
jgi:hypothetical protein